jgi:hypothetical protein
MTIDPLSIFQQRTPLLAATDVADLARLREAERLTLLARLDEQDGLIADLTTRFDDLETEQAAIVGALDKIAAIVAKLVAPKGASGPASALGEGEVKEDGADTGADLERSRQNAQRRWRQFRL